MFLLSVLSACYTKPKTDQTKTFRWAVAAPATTSLRHFDPVTFREFVVRTAEGRGVAGKEAVIYF